MKLRASITYNTLFEKLLKRRDIDERIEHLILATAVKTIDYLLLSYIQCKVTKAPLPIVFSSYFLHRQQKHRLIRATTGNQAQIDRYLPSHKEWFKGALNVFLRSTKIPGVTNGVSRPFTLQGSLKALLPKSNALSIASGAG